MVVDNAMNELPARDTVSELGELFHGGRRSFLFFLLSEPKGSARD